MPLDSAFQLVFNSYANEWAPEAGVLYGAQFGVTDEASDQSAALQAMNDFAVANNIRHLRLSGKIHVANTVRWSYGIMVEGELSDNDASRPATTIIPLAGGLFIQDFIFGFNMAANMIDNIVPGFFFGGGMRNILIDNLSGSTPIVANLRGIKFIGHGMLFENFGHIGLKQLIQRGGYPNPNPNNTDAYSDTLRISRAFFLPIAGETTYQIELLGGGDGAVIDQWNASQTPSKALAIRSGGTDNSSTFGARVVSCINGDILIEGTNVEIDNWHCENAQLIVGEYAKVTVSNTDFGQGSVGAVPVVTCQGSANDKRGSYLALRDCKWRDYGPLTNANFNGSSHPCEVAISLNTHLVVDNCHRAMNGSSSDSCDTGIRVGQASNSNALISHWSAYSDHLSRHGEILPGYHVPLQCPVAPANSFPGSYGLGGVAIKSGLPAGSWKAATGVTYFYQIQRLYDPIVMAGRNGAAPELNQPVANDARWLQLVLFGFNNNAPIGMVRVYRGVASGSYSHYANVPLIGPGIPNLVDDGARIAGVPWIARTAGPMDSITPVTAGIPYVIEGPGVIRATKKLRLAATNGDWTIPVSQLVDQVAVLTLALTNNRTYTIPATGRNDDTIEFVRTAASTGAFNVSISNGTATLAILPAPPAGTVSRALIRYVEGVPMLIG